MIMHNQQVASSPITIKTTHISNATDLQTSLTSLGNPLTVSLTKRFYM